MVISWSWFREKWYSTSADSPQCEWDRIAEKMTLEVGESRHPVFSATSPLSIVQIKSKGGNCRFTFVRWNWMRAICIPIKGQWKITKTRTCRFFHKNNTCWRKNLDRCWTRRKFNLRSCSVEEINSSSSSWKSTSRQWRDWILENKRLSSEPFCALPTLVWRQVEDYHGRRRRKQEKISVLYWFFRRSSLPLSSSRSFRTQSHWSYFTGQCRYSGRFLPIHVSCRMCNQFTFHYQFGTDTWRLKFEQKTDSILSSCGSHGQKP